MIKDLEFCEQCVYGKATKVKFGTGLHKTRSTLDYIHSDLWGQQEYYLEERQGISYPS